MTSALEMAGLMRHLSMCTFMLHSYPIDAWQELRRSVTIKFTHQPAISDPTPIKTRTLDCMLRRQRDGHKTAKKSIYTITNNLVQFAFDFFIYNKTTHLLFTLSNLLKYAIYIPLGAIKYP